MTGVVQFNYTTWSVFYSKLAAKITRELAELIFEMAELYCDNTPCSPVQNLKQRSMLLNMLVAHIAIINYGANGNDPSPLVGRISQATEGTVSVTAANDYPPGTAQWYQTTTYGSQFYAATGQFRTGFYMAPAGYDSDPFDTLFIPGANGPYG